MTEMSLGRAISRLAGLRPDEVAVTDGSGASLTWAALDRRSNATARVLTAHGVAVDDVVTYALPSDIEFVVLTVAVWKAGATPQPLDDGIGDDELTAILDSTRPAAIVGLRGRAPAGVALLDAARLHSPEIPDGPVEDRWAASWKAPTSSGSTGSPKVVFSAAPARIDPSAPTASYIPAQSTQLVPTPLHHAAQFLFAMRGLLLGHRLVLMPRFDPAAVLRLVAQHRVTWMVLNPPAMQRIWHLDERVRETADMSSLSRILHVGAACPSELKRGWLDWLGPEKVDEIYSGTESIGVTHIGGREWLAHPGSVGRPVQGCELQIVDEHDDRVEPGTAGRVFLKPRGGPGSTYRYAGGRAADIVDGHETLGDLGWVDDEGYLYLLDRAADVITTASGVIYPAQVEAALASHPDVRTCVVVGRGPRGRQRVHAVVDVGDRESADGATLARWAADRVPSHAVPDGIDLVREPVRDDFGKARRSSYVQP